MNDGSRRDNQTPSTKKRDNLSTGKQQNGRWENACIACQRGITQPFATCGASEEEDIFCARSQCLKGAYMARLSPEVAYRSMSLAQMTRASRGETFDWFRKTSIAAAATGMPRPEGLEETAQAQTYRSTSEKNQTVVRVTTRRWSKRSSCRPVQLQLQSFLFWAFHKRHSQWSLPFEGWWVELQSIEPLAQYVGHAMTLSLMYFELMLAFSPYA